MSDQGERTCPLCAEEMDLTDQQLKPCKCGYEICVWCWHHIIDMAEKDDTEGRCPACRTPYDKEKIVGMASNERLAEIQSERKLKSQKPKPKASDGRKHLSSVRVIQRNLVYIIGIPSNLADEDLLQRREYFAQYGKVLKVSIARTAGGAIQHSPNNTCSVYITYSKEEEAVRCIQLVHGYILEGKPLRACFGTTKYCHAWLRNMTCSNPDCLYLHEIGTQEDSFTKDEIISSYSRNRVQQITGATNNLQRRSGNTLPPPMDDFGVNNTAPSAPSAKPIAKLTTNNPGSHPKGSPPNGSSGRSAALPAAASWGLRISDGRPPTASSTGLSEPARQGVDTCNGSSTAVTGNTIQGSTLYSDVGIKSFENEESQVQHSNGGLGQLESSKQYDGKDVQAAASDSLAEVVRKVVPATTTSSGQLPSTQKDSDRGLRMQPNITQTEELGRQSHASASDANVIANGTIQSLSSTLLSMGIDSHSGSGNSDVIKPNISDSDVLLSKSSGHHASKQYDTEHVREPLISLQPRKAPVESDGVSDSRDFFDLRSESPPQALPNTYSGVDVVSLRSYDGRCNMSDGVTRNAFGITGLVDSGHEEVEKTSGLFLSRNSVLPNGYDESKISKNSELGKISGNSNLFVNVEKGEYSGRLNKTAFDMTDAGTDMGENSIISNILSMDFDAWDDSLTSPHNLIKLLSKTDKQHDSLKLSSSLKVQNSNQSRFSFARQEDFANPGSDLDNSFNNLGHNKYSHPQDYTVDRDPCSDKLRNGFTSSMFAETDTFPSNLSLASSSKLAASRSQISAPPGFSIPSRTPAPPPGFFSQERMEQTFESVSGNHLLDSSMLRNQYLAQTGGVADIELIDPAILAVGKGRLPNGINSGLDMRSTYTPQLSPPENDLRLQMLMQQSISQHQNLRYPDHNVDRFSALSDAYRVQSRYLEQTQASNLSPFEQLSLQQSRNAHMLNGHWDKVQTSNELGMAELLRNERLGLNKHYPSYEDKKFRMPSSGDIYKRAFGI